MSKNEKIKSWFQLLNSWSDRIHNYTYNYQTIQYKILRFKINFENSGTKFIWNSEETTN